MYTATPITNLGCLQFSGNYYKIQNNNVVTMCDKGKEKSLVTEILSETLGASSGTLTVYTFKDGI